MMFFGCDRETSAISYFQLTPFNTIHHFLCDDHINKQSFLINLIGNIFVFSPFGWLGLTIKKLNKIIPLILFFILTISLIEITQSITGRGVADIDDVILNTIGMLFGYSTFKFATWKNIANIRFYLYLKYTLQVSNIK
ncbi:VanZ like family protein [Chryseobacterium soldanellicola]|uniref:VanZ like family protein n=1 Tax=Chryseobacterium soldanellicola TaxID=311333 RepID=A0A1H0YXH0_9FLAO|nr:VanZ family protein [Chryseobacterium soldanellicola]SDQ19875.1 VanZ like family protein [Chryseobacterium soldanellicola]